MDNLRVKSVSKGVSEVDPITLSISSDNTRRLVFLPLIHNYQSKNGSVRGTFVYQRKRKTDEWDDDWDKVQIADQSLSKLKSGEGYQLDLSSDAVTKLTEGLMQIEEIAKLVNSGNTNTTYVPTKAEIAPILKKLINSTTNNELIGELSKLGTDAGLRLNDLVLQSRMRSAVKYWEAHKSDADEEAWQKFFANRPWIFTLLFAEPIVILKSKMYVGGTNATAKGGKTVDFGFINRQTMNTALLELKTPVTSLLGKEYRGIFPPSNELGGSIVQVQNYKYELHKNLRAASEDFEDFDAANIPTYVLAGCTEELDTKIKRRSFELNRKDRRHTIVLTFDEVFEKLRLLEAPTLS
ncbi:MAG TPA: Shedu immune nuclease family protein [Candidatus Chromulinivoraceae bacterium]|nr:Shedu immune nuclease family protein [Candidatus Chromulinivoraceae bacterium]